MGKSGKSSNVYFVVIILLLMVTIWLSTVREQSDGYKSKAEFLSDVQSGNGRR